MVKREKWILIFTFAVITLATLPNQVNAQEARTGVKGGINISNLYINEVDDENARIGFNLGLYTQIPLLGDFLCLQPEIMYSTKGARATYDVVTFQGESKFNLNYIDVPVLATLKLGDAAEINLGPYFSYLIGANVSTDGELGSGVSEVKRENLAKFDVGLTAGFALNFGTFSVGTRYNYGLRKIADTSEAELFLGDAKNSVAQVYAAFGL